MQNLNLSPSTKTVIINGLRYIVSSSSGDETELNYRLDLLSIPAISMAVEVKANDVSQIPAYAYQKTPQGRIRLSNDLDARLNWKPNLYMTASQFWKVVAQQAIVGECFIDVSNPASWNILPFGSAIRYTTPEREVRYATVLSPKELQAQKLKPSDVIIKQDFSYNQVLHIFSFQDDDGTPQAIRSRFIQILNLASNFYRYTSNIYNRGGVAVGYLSSEQSVAPEKKKENINWFKKLLRGGGDNAPGSLTQGIAYLDQGTTFTALNLNPQEMMLQAQKKDLQDDYCQIVGIPPWKIGLLDGYKYASAEVAQIEYITNSLNPLLNQIESEINGKLFQPFERDAFYVEFNRDAIIALDKKTMAEIDDLSMKNGTMTPNQFLARRNMPSMPNGDTRLIPVAYDSDTYKAQKEILNLQGIQLQNALLQKQLDAPLALPATPAPAPVAESAGDSPNDAQDQLNALQSLASRYIDSTPDQIKDPAYFGDMVRSIVDQLANRFGVTPHIGAFAEKYIATASKRIGEAQAISPAYEVNRAINAANFESMRLAHGVNAPVKWVGGQRDGQTNTLGQPWEGTMRHPPLNDGDTGSYLTLFK